MIQINLLPEEFRRPDRTPLPLFLTILFGIIVVGAMSVWLLALRRTVTNLEQENATLQQENAALKREAAVVDKIIAEIRAQKKRQDTIIGISMSKIMWSQKLIQLAQVFDDGYSDFWISSMTMNQTGRGVRGRPRGRKGKGGSGGTLVLRSFCAGDDDSRIADFRDRLKNDTNFWYHFMEIRAPVIRREDDKLSFTLTLLLRG